MGRGALWTIRGRFEPKFKPQVLSLPPLNYASQITSLFTAFLEQFLSVAMPSLFSGIFFMNICREIHFHAAENFPDVLFP